MANFYVGEVLFGPGGSIETTGDIKISAILDSVNSPGSAGQILSSTGSTLEWITPAPSGVVTISGTSPVSIDASDPQNPVISVGSASTSSSGVVQLNDTVTSTSTTQAATANAAKTAYDAALAAQATANAALPKAGGTMSGNISFSGTQTFPVSGIQGATTSQVGVVQLYDDTNSTSNTLALTASQGKNLQDQINALASVSNLTLAGTINASTGNLISVTSDGIAAGFTVGSPLPAAAAGNTDYFVIVTVPGTMTPPGGTAQPCTQGDWWASDGSSWLFLDVGFNAPYATTTSDGVVQLATDSEVQAGTDSTHAVVPSSLQSKLSDSISTTSSTTIASSTAVKCAYDIGAAAIPKATITAKGDIVSGTASGTPSVVSVGADSQILAACSACPSGLYWAGAASLVCQATPSVRGILFGCAPSDGSLNASLGQFSLNSITTGTCNTAFGTCSLASVSTSNQNTAVGSLALNKATGFCNTAIGAGSASCLTTGCGNMVIGGFNMCGYETDNSRFIITDGFGVLRIVMNGCGALALNPAANSLSTANTYGLAGQVLTSAGWLAPARWCNLPTPGIPCSLLTAKGAIVSGAAAGIPTTLTVGTNGQILSANSACTSGLQWINAPAAAASTAQGLVFGCSTSVNNINALGFCALPNGPGTGTSLVAIGFCTLGSNTSGISNIAIGLCSQRLVTSGGSNVSMGSFSMWNATTGSRNTAIGRDALLSLTTGGCNTAIGCCAGAGITTGSGNVFIGGFCQTGCGTCNNHIVLSTNGTGEIRLIVNDCGAWSVSGLTNYGTSGQVFMSTGETSPPVWCSLSLACVPCSAYTAKGSILGGTGTSTFSALSVGTNGQFLAANSACTTGLEWCTISLACVPCSSYTAKGAILGGTGTSTFSALSVGTNGQLLVADSSCPNGLKWQDNLAIPCSCITAKGTLVSGSAANTPTALGVGFEGQYLSVCSACPTGLAWSYGNLSYGDTPVGAIMWFPANSVPGGFIVANGAAVSRTSYAELFSVIGTTYGAGDGSTTFNLPDLRGQFIRGWDAAGGSARGCDPGRVFGSSQGDCFRSHNHVLCAPAGDANSSSSQGYTGTGCCFISLRTSDRAPAITSAACNQAMACTGGTETRPMNVAMLPCIKWRQTLAPADCGMPIGTFTSKGQVLSSSAAGSPEPVPAPTNGQFLIGNTVASPGMVWCSLISGKGALLTGTAANAPTALPVGTDGQLLLADSACTTGLKWGSLFTAKGDLVVGGASGVTTVLPVGSDATALIACSACPSGVTWGGITPGCVSVSANSVFAGACLGSSIATALYNSTFGICTGCSLTTGCYNTAIGSWALRFSTTGCYNTALGTFSGGGITTGSCNTIIGAPAGQSLTTGCNNVLLGLGAGGGITTHSNNVAVGTASFASSLGDSNTVVGNQAMQQFCGSCNVAIGSGALSSSTVSGVCNGFGNVAIGFNAGRSNVVLNSCGSSRSCHVSIGLCAGLRQAAWASIGGVMIGACAGWCANAAGQGLYTGASVGVGACALYAEQGLGFNNTAIGTQANQAVTTGSDNVSLGSAAGYTVTTGNGNVFIGVNAGQLPAGNFMTGSYNIGIGWCVAPSSGSVNCEVTIQPNTSASRARFQGTQTAWSFSSDARLKENVQDLALGLDFVKQLQPRTFDWISSGCHAAGFIAQEVNKVVQANNAEHLEVVNTDDPECWMVAKDNLIPVLVNAVKELSTQLEQTRAELNELRSKL